MGRLHGSGPKFKASIPSQEEREKLTSALESAPNVSAGTFASSDLPGANGYVLLDGAVHLTAT